MMLLEPPNYPLFLLCSHSRDGSGARVLLGSIRRKRLTRLNTNRSPKPKVVRPVAWARQAVRGIFITLVPPILPSTIEQSPPIRSGNSASGATELV
jgi:hypothetical protein